MAAPSLVVATLVVEVLEAYVGVPNASVVYLTAVVATAIVGGTLGAVVASIASFLLYDFFFVEPTLTFTISDPAEWLALTLLLFVGIVVGQLAARQRARAEVAERREREARALFRVSRALATRESTDDVLPILVRTLKNETQMDRVWMALGEDDAAERPVADSEAGPSPAPNPVYRVLQQRSADEPAAWVRVQPPNVRGWKPDARDAYRVPISAGGLRLGSLWALRGRGRSVPDATAARLLAAAADQVGQILAHDRLEAEARTAEIATRSDALKSALLQSVSHDLRTPLATIRAAAGSLRPGSVLSVEDQGESADAIDREVEYLNRLVTNLLDLSRIEAGALRAEREIFELDDAVSSTLARLRRRLGTRPVTIDLAAPPVDADPVFLDDALTNVLENAIKYTGPDVAIRISARELVEGFARLTIEDAGAGVPDDLLPKIFEKFYRVPGEQHSSRTGTGIGLAVVRGLIEATGGRVNARRSDLGGLAIDIDLPAAEPLHLPPASSTAQG